jgi:hypothetical protein
MYFDLNNPNVGNTDRLIRAIVGALLIASVFLGGSWVGGLIGALLLGTAYLRFCPAYRIFNFSSKKDVAPAGK